MNGRSADRVFSRLASQLVRRQSKSVAQSLTPPFPGPGEVGPTEPLVDVFALIGDALVLDNGTFVRLLEVEPLDLERGDGAARARVWQQFSAALRRLRAPLGIQIVVTSRLQDISAYLAGWQANAERWRRLAETASDDAAAARRACMQRSAEETNQFLQAVQSRLMPMQQRYFVAVTENPFAEAISTKGQHLLLADATVGAALQKLEERVQLVISALGEPGLSVRSLSASRTCQVLWEHYHHAPGVVGGQSPLRNAFVPGVFTSTPIESQCPTTSEFQGAASDTARLADLLAPSLVEEHEHYLRVGEVVARGYLLYDFDPTVPVDAAAILAFQGDATHALYLTAADPAVIRQQFKEKETELRAATLVDAKRGAVTDWARQAAINSLEAARAEMETALQAPFFLHWYSLLWANDLETLDQRCRDFETLLKVRDIRHYPATRRHLSVLQTVRPISRPTYRLKPRNMSADSLGSFFPFVRREYLDPQGWHFGVHRGNGLLVCLNPFESGQSNASQLIIGTPGGGKSVYLKQMIETVVAQGHRVFIVDPEREYLRLAVDLHAPYVELGRRSEPWRLELDRSDPDSAQLAAQELASMYQSLAAAPVSGAQTRLLQDVCEMLLAEADSISIPDVMAQLRERGGPEADEIARVLSYTQALAGGNVLNIMDINPASENPWSAAAESLAAFVEAILGERLEAPTFNALVDAYQATMRKWGLDPEKPETWPAAGQGPTLSALVDTLAASPGAQSQSLAHVLQQYAYGLYADLFSQRTSVDLRSAQCAVFGLRALRENVERSLAPVFAWQVLRLVWNEVVAGGAAQPTHLVVDEAWYLLEQPGAATRLERMARSFRKYNAALYLATQDVSSLIASPEARAIAEIARIKLLFGQESESAVRALGEVFGLSRAEQGDILRASKGEGLLLFGNQMRIPLYVAVNPERLARLATNREQQQAVARASGRRAQVVV